MVDWAPGELFQGRVWDGAVVGTDSGEGAVGLGVQEVHEGLGVQASVAFGLFQGDSE